MLFLCESEKSYYHLVGMNVRLDIIIGRSCCFAVLIVQVGINLFGSGRPVYFSRNLPFEQITTAIISIFSDLFFESFPYIIRPYFLYNPSSIIPLLGSCNCMMRNKYNFVIEYKKALHMLYSGKPL